MKFSTFLLAAFAWAAASFPATAGSAEDVTRKLQFNYAAAATTLRMCTEKLNWNFEHDEAAQIEAENELRRLGIPKSRFRKVADSYELVDLERDLFNYYKARGIKRFLTVRDFRRGEIHNATPDFVRDSKTGESVPKNHPEFCALAEKERKAGTEIGKYFKAKGSR